ncbi:MAG: fibrinogen-like YCDxxxxGGGW domain-containing protein [Candidatus Thiodiazotropha sp.]
MNKGLVLFFVALVGFYDSASAAIGTLPTTPGYSAQSILMVNPAAVSGVYWLDTDGINQGNQPMQVFANMDTFGGGWSLASASTLHNAWPTLTQAGINDLAIAQTADILFSDTSTGFVGSFHGNYGQSLLPSEASSWMTNGIINSLLGMPWNAIPFNSYDIYVRESEPQFYSATVPVPAAVWLFSSALIGFIAFSSRRTI